jgi:hypothetical protein
MATRPFAGTVTGIGISLSLSLRLGAETLPESRSGVVGKRPRFSSSLHLWLAT